MNNEFPAGFICLNKPTGLTSQGAVSLVRRAFKRSMPALPKKYKVGHLGTLDPGADGVLPLALGLATRVIPYLPPARKAYVAGVHFGVVTDSLDADGEVISRAPVPPLSQEELESYCEPFRGEIMQVPPLVSALHVEGRRAYDLVRSGRDFSLPPRPAYYEGVRVLDWDGERAHLEVACGPGTYIRALARDLGEAVGCGASLFSLRRTRSGPFFLQNSITLQELREAIEQEGAGCSRILSVEAVWKALGLPRLSLSEEVRQGGQDYLVPTREAEEGGLLSLNEGAVALAFDPSGRAAGLVRLLCWENSAQRWHMERLLFSLE